MKFRAIQKTLSYTQLNTTTPEKVFPLLCPVREKDWIDGWEYDMIYSHSGLIEKNCVFSTPRQGEMDTVWHVTQYDPERYEIEFLRVTPKENVVRININLISFENDKTKAMIEYQYTALNEKQNEFINNELDEVFKKMMGWWEKSINHYLETGEQLKS
jgi:hypothetical protein